MTSLSEDMAGSYHHICLSRGIEPERVLLRRTASHCQKATDNNAAGDADNAHSLTDDSKISAKLNGISLTSSISELTLASLAQVSIYSFLKTTRLTTTEIQIFFWKKNINKDQKPN